MSTYNFFIMPLAFVRAEMQVQAVSLNADERKLIEFLKTYAGKDVGEDSDDFNVSLRIDIKFSKAKDDDAQKVRITNDPEAMQVALSEEDIHEKYPWNYSILTTRLKKRFTDFKANSKYHVIRRSLEDDERFCRKRYLDPHNPKSSVMRFYNSNIIKEFDAHYNRRLQSDGSPAAPALDPNKGSIRVE